MVDKYLYALVAFSITDLIGINRFIKIKKTFDDISDFLDCSVDDQMHLLAIKSDNARIILEQMKNQANRVWEECEKKNITLIPHNDPTYPASLKKIVDPPYLLYSKGTLNPQIPLVAVIGTRKSTSDAEEINRWFCKSFVNYGIGVVSGLAKGHDAIASHTVIQNEGYTVGVLGTAIDIIYPSSSTNLYHEIQEKGALISEYPPGMTSTKWRFPRRNRIVSGMSQAVFVVQAPERSGTLITVNMAISQGKDVYVVPGNPMKSQYEGTNTLLQNGAKIAINPEELIKEVLKASPNLETIQFISQKPTSPTLAKELDTSLCSPEEIKILELTKSNIYIDEILENLEINVSSLNSLLIMMEIKGLITQRPGQIYIRKDAE